MKWFFKKHKPTLGEERIKEVFPIIPISINGEYYWLEKVKIRQRYVGIWGGSIWLNLEFIK